LFFPVEQTGAAFANFAPAFAYFAVRIRGCHSSLESTAAEARPACVLGDEKFLLGSGTASGCNVLRVGEACARSSLQAAIHEACVRAGISPQEIQRTCAGVAGGARGEIADVLRKLLAGIVGGEIVVAGDMDIAFEDAFGAGPGVIIISGTGSIAYGRNARGETARAGGLGHAISDEGSGHWIGVAAIRTALRTRDWGENSGLLNNLMNALDAETVEELVVRVNANPAPDFASLFPVVSSAALAPRSLLAADAGDSIAKEVLEYAGNELGKLAETVIRRLFIAEEEVCVATHGGVLASSAQVKESLVEHMRTRDPRIRFISREIDPANGALARARRG
jgi:N-acetylglucosamine kinase-like BadF-type ATPase